VIAQLRDMLAAMQSAEVPEEHEHHGLVAPQVAEAVLRTRRVGKLDLGERVELHGAAV
jgi:hypothetical protein